VIKIRDFEEMQGSPVGSHLGVNRKHRKLKQYIVCKSVKCDIENSVRKHENNGKNKLTSVILE
jgi:hypothetical protein